MASALEGRGVEEVLTQIQAHLAWCCGDGRSQWEARRGRGRVRTFLDLVAEEARTQALCSLDRDETALRQDLEQGKENPYVAAERWQKT